ncbi:hypothetical protein BIW11_04475 [Tropilaelaps mercedesae]|uniref:Uncharacterized protein n=1 Tax=Tropilaelaps mercedesae TaxID=418985 RepID=A0A1V9X5M2_9ACAR|nr:hypothetical protein BIW11_04475 [Tropilaelaps mercedesae]
MADELSGPSAPPEGVRQTSTRTKMAVGRDLPQRGVGAATASRKSGSNASSVASSASTVKANSAGPERDPNSVVLVRKSLIPIRGWSSKGAHQPAERVAHGRAK